ncbi:TonB C-terminal domain-containing protein [Hydrocarboniphaga sp.]|uniref:TonB C-terminal domain-containing protein n=1 Tax=Hydrocarboniphaga sp. TaxID=2033016 RepID=UPI003D0AACA8
MLADPASLRAEHHAIDAMLIAGLPTIELAKRDDVVEPASPAQQHRLLLRVLPASFALHLLLALLVSGLLQLGRQAPPPRASIRAVMISSSVHSGSQSAEAVPTQANTAAAPAPAKPAPAPKPAPQAKPQAPTKPAKPAPPTPAKAASSAASASTSPVSKDQSGVEALDDADSLLMRLRANWLAPPRAAPVFRCRLRIDYRGGGMISAVHVEQGCGDRSLGDSIERAVWKTQPLPLPPDAPASGSLDLEFSP